MEKWLFLVNKWKAFALISIFLLQLNSKIEGRLCPVDTWSNRRIVLDIDYVEESNVTIFTFGNMQSLQDYDLGVNIVKDPETGVCYVTDLQQSPDSGEDWQVYLNGSMPACWLKSSPYTLDNVTNMEDTSYLPVEAREICLDGYKEADAVPLIRRRLFRFPWSYKPERKPKPKFRHGLGWRGFGSNRKKFFGWKRYIWRPEMTTPTISTVPTETQTMTSTFRTFTTPQPTLEASTTTESIPDEKWIAARSIRIVEIGIQC